MSELDKRILESLTGAERIRALLRGKGYPTHREFAVATGRYVEEVSMCLTGARRYDEIREDLARILEVDRAEVDRLIDGDQPAAEPTAKAS
jgi:hypothetical protein